MFKRILVASLFVSVALTSVACSTVLNQVTGGSANTAPISQLWSDVPKMDGLTPSKIDMPVFVKLIMRTVIGNLGRFSPEDSTTGNIDWIAFTTAKTPADVQNYYSAAVMTGTGWETGKDTQCLSGSDQGFAQVGVICGFVKNQAGKNIALGIIAVPDDQTKLTNVFFLRLEVAATPVPTNQPS
jgi:hypothetical protein